MENLLMNNFFLTTFNKRLYNEYAKDFIKTYLDTKQTIPLVCYVEEDDFSIYPQHKNIKYFNIFEEVPEIKSFIKRNENKPVKTYMYDGVRFCYKVYAQYAGRNLGKRQFFVDADCVFMKQIPEEWYDNFIGECDFSYYPRPSMYSETGFVVFNCESKLVQKFFDRYIESYNTDEIYSMKTQNDSVVFDNILKEFPQRTETLHGAGDNLETHRYGRHVMARCPVLSPYVDHRKGNRKKQKNSPELLK
jgi:hypothetical protein